MNIRVISVICVPFSEFRQLLKPVIFLVTKRTPLLTVRQESPFADQQALAFQKGDEKALAFFFDELYAGLCIYAHYYMDNEAAAQDIVIEAFLKTWKTRSQFSRAGSIRAYLYTVVRRDAITWWKNQKKLTDINDSQGYVINEQENDNPFTNLVRAETVRYLHKAINTLPPQCRKVFELLYIEGKSVKETADILHLSPSTVKTQKQRGLEALRKHLSFPFFFLAAAYLQKIVTSL